MRPSRRSSPIPLAPVLGLVITLVFLVFNPIVVGLIGYSSGRVWPAAVCLGALLIYTVLAVPLVLEAPPPSYCHGHPDCPDPDTRGFAFALGFAWLIADCMAGVIGGIFGDNSAHRPTAGRGAVPSSSQAPMTTAK